MRKSIRAAVVSGGLAVLACPLPALAEDGVKIGLIEPLTGSVAYNGHEVIDGSKVAVREINAKGGVLGKPLSLVIEDDQCKPANSVNAVEKLIEKDQVAALIGAFCSSATAAIMPVAARYKIPLLTGVSSAAALTEQGNPYFFRAAETDALLADAFARILADNLKLKTVAYVGVNDDWGRGGVAGFEKSLSALGVKTVMTEYFDHGTTDFLTLATKLRAANVDGIFVAAETQDGSTLMKQFRQMGVTTKVFGVGSWATADFISLTGPAAEGLYAAVPYVATEDTPLSAAFVKAYEDAFGSKPGKYGAAGYNTVHIMAEAIARAGSTDPEAIRQALAKTHYEAPNGVYQFTDKGQAYGFNAVLVQIHNGAPVVVASSPVQAH